MLALVILLLPPSSHSIARSLAISLARHQLSATTATPLSIGTTLMNPRRPCNFVASTDLTFPPITGVCTTAAYTMPGNCTSMPKRCRPHHGSGDVEACSWLADDAPVFRLFELHIVRRLALARGIGNLTKRQLAPAR